MIASYNYGAVVQSFWLTPVEQSLSEYRCSTTKATAAAAAAALYIIENTTRQLRVYKRNAMQRTTATRLYHIIILSLQAAEQSVRTARNQTL